MTKLNPKTVKPGDYLFVKGNDPDHDYVVLVENIEISDIIEIYDKRIFRRPGTYDPRWKKSHYDEPIDMLKSTFAQRVFISRASMFDGSTASTSSAVLIAIW